MLKDSFKPVISIITVTLNSEKTVEQTILSVLSQTYPNIEYLIIDGGSTDNTLKIIGKYIDKIDYVISEKDNGISGAFNKGIYHATGEIIGIINSDDILLPNAIAIVAENYESTVNVYRGNIFLWDDKTDRRKKEVPSMNFNLWNIIPRVAHQGTFVTKSTYLKYGSYDEKFKYMMDLDLLMQLYHKRATFKYINAELALYRLGGLTSTKIEKKKDEIKMYVYNNGGTYIHFIAFYYPRLLIQYCREKIGFKKCI